MDPVTGATEASEQSQVDSQATQTLGTETTKEAIPAQNTGTDGAKPVESDTGGIGAGSADDEPITLSREVYNNLLNLSVAGGQVPPTTSSSETPSQKQPQLEPPAYFNFDEQTFNQALRDPQAFSQVMNESVFGAITEALTLYEQRNMQRIEDGMFNVLASKEIITTYPELKGRGDVVQFALQQTRNQNPGASRDALIEKTHDYIKKNIGLARKIEQTNHDHIPKTKVPGQGPSARSKGGESATLKTNRSAKGGTVTELSRLGLT
jgi:hypothetical protein